MSDDRKYWFAHSRWIRPGGWFVGVGVFFLLLYCGRIENHEETIRFSQFASRLWKEGLASITLIFPAVAGTVILAIVFAAIHWIGRWSCQYFKMWRTIKTGRIPVALCSSVLLAESLLISILSAVPPFISGIFLIRFAHLDTIHSHNFLYGILCLAAFNLSYFYKRTQQRISELYGMPCVVFARSQGLPEYTIFRNYVLPGMIHDTITIIRELLPHITMESVIIEHTFSYNGLLRAAIQAIIYPNPWGWYYFGISLYLLLLGLTLVSWLCRLLENYFAMPGEAS